LKCVLNELILANRKNTVFDSSTVLLDDTLDGGEEPKTM